MSLMGGTDNIGIVWRGTSESIEADVRDKLARGIDIIGPECAVPLQAPYGNLRRIAEAVIDGGVRSGPVA